jgi:hypothetical protein
MRFKLPVLALLTVTLLFAAQPTAASRVDAIPDTFIDIGKVAPDILLDIRLCSPDARK